MYKTKGVEPNQKVQVTISRFLLNITLKHSLSLFDPFFHSPLTLDHVTSPIKPMWIEEWLILLLSWDSGMEPAHGYDCWKGKKKESLRFRTCTFKKKTHLTKSSWEMLSDNCDSRAHLMLVAHADSLGFLLNPRVNSFKISPYHRVSVGSITLDITL